MTTQDVVNLSVALTNAVVSGQFMSRDHAKKIWLKLLRDSGFDVPQQFERFVEKPVEEVKK